MPTRIGPSRPHRIFMAEWRAKRELTQAQLADRLEVDKTTISRWERYARAGEVGPISTTRGLDTDTLAAIAEALDCHPSDLYRHPDTPSADELIRDWPPERQAMALDALKAFGARKAS